MKRFNIDGVTMRHGDVVFSLGKALRRRDRRVKADMNGKGLVPCIKARIVDGPGKWHKASVDIGDDDDTVWCFAHNVVASFFPDAGTRDRNAMADDIFNFTKELIL